MKSIEYKSVFCTSCKQAATLDANSVCELCRLRWKPTAIFESRSVERACFAGISIVGLFVAVFTLEPIVSLSVIIVGVVLLLAHWERAEKAAEDKAKKEKERKDERTICSTVENESTDIPGSDLQACRGGDVQAGNCEGNRAVVVAFRTADDEGTEPLPRLGMRGEAGRHVLAETEVTTR